MMAEEVMMNIINNGREDGGVEYQYTSTPVPNVEEKKKRETTYSNEENKLLCLT